MYNKHNDQVLKDNFTNLKIKRTLNFILKQNEADIVFYFGFVNKLIAWARKQYSGVNNDA